ncbi:hypothetical protein T439DRAFT_321822 [Meredithblackwellia eburnea MCA 4105]
MTPESLFSRICIARGRRSFAEQAVSTVWRLAFKATGKLDTFVKLLLTMIFSIWVTLRRADKNATITSLAGVQSMVGPASSSVAQPLFSRQLVGFSMNSVQQPVATMRILPVDANYEE